MSPGQACRDPRAPPTAGLSIQCCRQLLAQPEGATRHKGPSTSIDGVSTSDLLMCLTCRPQSRGPSCPVNHHPGLFFFPELSCTSLEKHICPCCLWETQLCFSWSCLQGPTREDSIQRQTGQDEHRDRVAGWTQGPFLPGVTGNGSLRVPSSPLPQPRQTQQPQKDQLSSLPTAPRPPAHHLPSTHRPEPETQRQRAARTSPVG